MTAFVGLCPMQFSMTTMDMDMGGMHMHGAAEDHETIAKKDDMGTCTHCLQAIERTAIKIASIQHTETTPIAVALPAIESPIPLNIQDQVIRARDGPDTNLANIIQTIVLRV